MLFVIAVLLALILWALIDRESALAGIGYGCGCIVLVVLVCVAGGAGAAGGYYLARELGLDANIGAFAGGALGLWGLWSWSQYS